MYIQALLHIIILFSPFEPDIISRLNSSAATLELEILLETNSQGFTLARDV